MTLEATLAVCISMGVRMLAAAHSHPLDRMATQVRQQRPTPDRVPISQALSRQLEFKVVP